MNKLKTYNGQTPTKQIALKIDGIQAIRKGDVVFSRKGKPLHNIDATLLEEGKHYEIFVENFSTTQSIVKRRGHPRRVERTHCYEIWPGTDKRLRLNMVIDVKTHFANALKRGYEGLVIDQLYKMKPIETYDVPVMGIQAGKGKHVGRMGALITPMGKVGGGFSDRERKRKWQLGTLIEVECMQLTADGKFRHPRFVRIRWDKG